MALEESSMLELAKHDHHTEIVDAAAHTATKPTKIFQFEPSLLPHSNNNNNSAADTGFLKMKTLSSSHHSKVTNSTVGMGDSSSSHFWMNDYDPDAEPTEEGTETDFGESFRSMTSFAATSSGSIRRSSMNQTYDILQEEEPVTIEETPRRAFSQNDSTKNQQLMDFTALTDLLVESNQEGAECADGKRVSARLTVDKLTHILTHVNAAEEAGFAPRWDLIQKLAYDTSSCNSVVSEEEISISSFVAQSKANDSLAKQHVEAEASVTETPSESLNTSAGLDDLPKRIQSHLACYDNEQQEQDDDEASIDPLLLWDEAVPEPVGEKVDRVFRAHRGLEPRSAHKEQSFDITDRDLKLIHSESASDVIGASTSSGRGGHSASLSELERRHAEEFETESTFSLECDTESVASSVTWHEDAYDEVAVSHADSSSCSCSGRFGDETSDSDTEKAEKTSLSHARLPDEHDEGAERNVPLRRARPRHRDQDRGHIFESSAYGEMDSLEYYRHKKAEVDSRKSREKESRRALVSSE